MSKSEEQFKCGYEVREFGLLQRRDIGYTGQRTLKMEMPGMKKIEETHGRSEGGQADGWCDKGGC